MTKTIVANDFMTPEAAMANKLVDYYEGRQLDHVINILNHQRKEWQQRGMIPRTRNITKAIVDKSIPLFSKMPSLEVWADGAEVPIVDQVLMDMFYKVDALQFFANVDTYTRLLKSTVVLCQKYVKETVTVDGIYHYNDETDALMPTLLHAGNCVVRMDPSKTIITEIAWLTSDDPVTLAQENGDDYVLSNKNFQNQHEWWTYRVMTLDAIFDVLVVKPGYTGQQAEERVYEVGVNPDGLIPAKFFYDTNKPRQGVWHKVPEDLASLQEIVNLALTDMEFAIAHAKQKTLFTNTKIIDNGDTNPVITTFPRAMSGNLPAHQDANTMFEQTQGMVGKPTIGGLGAVVVLDMTPDGSQPLVKFDGPNTDLKPLSDIMMDMIEGVAADWSVQLKLGVSNQAQSGFQLLVQEMPNLLLRDKRITAFQGAMCGLYHVLRVLYPELTDGELIIKFADAQLPVNSIEQDTLWKSKIEGNRASLLDYFMEVKSMSRDEALAKIQEVVTVNRMVSLDATGQSNKFPNDDPGNPPDTLKLPDMQDMDQKPGKTQGTVDSEDE